MPPKRSSYPRRRLYGKGAYRVGRPYIKGQGSYSIVKSLKPYTKGWAARAGGYLGSLGGGALGNVIAPGIGGATGAAIGGMVGRGAGKTFARLSGWGDYKVSRNTILGLGMTREDGAVPSFGEGTIRIRDREPVGHINASTTFQNTIFPINPGNDTTFPRLSAIANNFEQWRPNGLVFYYKSTCSDAIASTTDLGLGQVILATDYNAAADPFINELQMLGSMFANANKPSRDIMHAVECAPTDTQQKSYFVRSGSVPPGQDAKLYDLGIFQVATTAMQAAYTGMGQLWVAYDITLMKPVQNNQVGFSLNTDQFPSFTGQSNALPFGTAYTENSENNLGSSFTNGTTFAFPPLKESGYYLWSWNWQGTNNISSAITFTYNNCSLMNSNSSSSATAHLKYNTVQIIRINNRNATIVVSGANLPTGTITSNCMVTQVNGLLFP